MPINYSRYPPHWKELRESVLIRAENKCEFCGKKNYSTVWAVRYRRRSKWYETFEEADEQPRTIESNKSGLIPNPKPVKVILTIAHLDHDETNHKVLIHRLKALCQMCHLRYDAKEKYLRSIIKVNAKYYGNI
jgi:hypothetical protein